MNTVRIKKNNVCRIVPENQLREYLSQGYKECGVKPALPPKGDTPPDNNTPPEGVDISIEDEGLKFGDKYISQLATKAEISAFLDSIGMSYPQCANLITLSGIRDDYIKTVKEKRQSEQQ